MGLYESTPPSLSHCLQSFKGLDTHSTAGSTAGNTLYHTGVKLYTWDANVLII